MKSLPKHVEFLDYARGVAILLVLLFHCLAHVYGYDELPWNGWHRSFSVPISFDFLLPCSFGREAGVAIFFVVSGFCIHLSFQSQGRNWKEFFLRRFFHIYPAYFAALVFSVLVIYSCAYADLGSAGSAFWTQLLTQLLTHVFLVHNFSAQTSIGINGPFWSLAVEAQLYLLYPLLLAFVSRFRWRQTLAILMAIEIVIRSIDGVVQTLGIADTAAGRVSWAVSFSPLGFWFSWSIGAFLAEAFSKNEPLPFLKISPLVWLGAAVTSYFFKATNSFQFLFFALATAAFMSRLFTRASTPVPVPATALAVLKKFGLWSYSIYLLHQPLLNTFALVALLCLPGSPMIMFLLILCAWLPILVISALWYRLFELPAIAFGKLVVSKMDHSGVNLSPQSGRHVNVPAIIVPRQYYGLLAMALLTMVAGTLYLGAKLTPPSPGKNNNLAWSLATNPDPARRNGALAVKLAEDACRRTQYRQTIFVGTLAVAYAEDGRFDDAIRTAQQACQMALQNGETNLFQRNQASLGLFQEHRAYHEPPQPGMPK